MTLLNSTLRVRPEDSDIAFMNRLGQADVIPPVWEEAVCFIKAPASSALSSRGNCPFLFPAEQVARACGLLRFLIEARNLIHHTS